MQYLNGDLVVQKRSGSRGDFNVAEIVTEIGKFTVKYNLLDQYQAGTYAGRFLVSKIKAVAFPLGATGKLIVETRADLEDVQLTTFDDQLSDDVIDPVPDDVDKSEEDCNRNTPQSLFGKLWPLGEEVKLDSTENRAILRDQISYLNANGYELEFPSQVFRKKS